MVKSKESLELIKLLRVDVYIALFMFGYGVYQVTNTQLIQEKICRNELGEDAITCGDLSSGEGSVNGLQSTVLSMATSIHNYQTLVSTIPGVIQSFFFGYWIDKYPSHIRFLLVLPCTGLLLEALIMIYQCLNFDIPIIYSLWAHLALGLGGSQSLALAAVFTYAAKKTPQKFRSIRFAILELFIFASYPIGVAAGGKVLAANTWFGSERRNFTGVFGTAALAMVIGITWAITFIDDLDQSEPKETTATSVTSTTGETSMTEVDLNDGPKTVQVQERPKVSPWTVAADIFNFKNVYLTFRTFFKERPNNGRHKVVLLASCVLNLFLSLLAETMFGFQYTEKAFLWDYQHYSYIYAYLQLTQALGTVVGAIFLKKTLGLQDAEVGVIGTISHFLGNLIKGIPSVPCYITGSLLFVLTGVTLPAIRSCLTSIIEFNEIGQILAVVSCLQALGPLTASMLTTTVFNDTIDTAPGTTYHALAINVLPPLVILIWVSLTSEQENDQKVTTRVRFQAGDADDTVDIQGLGESEGGKKF